MNWPTINRYGGLVGAAVLFGIWVNDQFPNGTQVELAKSVAENLLSQSRQGVQEIQDVGQGFGADALRDVQSLDRSYGKIQGYRFLTSRRIHHGVVLEYAVERDRATTRERFTMNANRDRSYGHDRASVDRHEFLAAVPGGQAVP